MTAPSSNPIVLGDPVPWFQAFDLAGKRVDLHVSAGRWIVLAFFDSFTATNSPSISQATSPPDPKSTSPFNPRPISQSNSQLDAQLNLQASSQPSSQKRLDALVLHASRCTEDHLVVYVILATPPDDPTALVTLTRPNLKFIADYDGAVAALFGARQSPRTIMLDLMLRAVANIPWDASTNHDQVLDNFLATLPSVDNSAGAPLVAPVLTVPRVFDFPLCENLIAVFEKIGGTDSGFLIDHAGQPATIVDHSRKSRQDLLIVSPELRALIRERIVKRLVPAIERYFQFRATHMDRYIVARYDSDSGGHFSRHRDNLSPGVEHRRFAVSLNLNSGYEGCDLIFPEFGRRAYRAPAGGAMVFSCGALHEVAPITKGRRYAFLPFLYGESDVKKSLENTALLERFHVDYQTDEHSLFAGSQKVGRRKG